MPAGHTQKNKLKRNLSRENRIGGTPREWQAIEKKTMESKNESREQKIVRVTLVGSVVNFVLVVLKFLAGVLGHSSAMIADAVHSLSDFVTDVIVLIFVRISAKPQDEGHDYGHGKFETLATAIIGIVLFGVGLKLLWDGGEKIIGFYFRDEPLQSPGTIALWAALLSIVAKEVLYRYTVRVGRQQHSQSLIANAWHHRSDALSSIGTAIGVGGAILLGPSWNVLDPIAAVVVSVLIMRVAIQLILPAVNELLEKSLPAETEQEILQIIAQTPEVSHPHGLRTRSLGNGCAIEVHIRVDPQMSVAHAHELTREIEQRLRQRFGQETHIMLHVEPWKPETVA